MVLSRKQTRSSLLWKHTAIFFLPLFRSGALHISSGILSKAHWPPVNRQDSFHFNHLYPSYFFFMHKELVWIIYLIIKNYITMHPSIMPKMPPNTPVKIEIFMVFYILWSSLEIWPFSYWLNCNFSKTAYNWIIQWNMPEGIKSDGNKNRKLYNVQYKLFGCSGFNQSKQGNKITGDWITWKDHALDLKTPKLLGKVCWIQKCSTGVSPRIRSSQGVLLTEVPELCWRLSSWRKTTLII